MEKKRKYHYKNLSNQNTYMFPGRNNWAPIRTFPDSNKYHRLAVSPALKCNGQKTFSDSVSALWTGYLETRSPLISGARQNAAQLHLKIAAYIL